MKNDGFDRNNDAREREIPDDLIIGRNAVREALKAGRAIDTILVARGEIKGSLSPIAAMAKDKNIVVKEVDKKKLDFLSGHSNHQSVIACCAAHEYSSIDDIMDYAAEKGESPFIIICDEIEDPHNLGAIIRTAEAGGAHGIIIPKRRSASLNYIVAKTASGALEYVRVARVANLPTAIDELKKRGVWIYGSDMDGTDYSKTDFSGAVGLIVGSEGSGMGRLVREKCDFIVSLPMRGKINSLNASVAAGIFIYEIAKQRSSD